MARLAAGDRAAFDEVFAALWPLVSSFARRLLQEEHEAEDAAQRALLKLFQQASRFDPERSAVSWALALTAWECRSTSTTRRRRGASSLEGCVPDPGPGPEQRALDADLVVRVAATLTTLSSEDQRTLHEALDGDGDAPKDAAFRKRKQRALARLKQKWRALHA